MAGKLCGCSRPVCGVLALLVSASPAAAQPVTERSPNVERTWVASPRTLHILLSHRFSVVGDDADISDIFGDGKIVNYPTFALTYGVVKNVDAGIRYSSNSLVADGANDWVYPTPVSNVTVMSSPGTMSLTYGTRNRTIGRYER